MRNSANKTLIGLFVVGAVALVIAVLAVLGSGWFRAETTFIMYFEGSVTGLTPGSSVTFKGVPVGSVTRIAVQYDPSALVVLVPVYVEIDTGKIGIVGKHDQENVYQLKPLIEKGLRAQLQTISYVTGQLVVALDFFPDTPVHLVGLDRRYTEIPTVPSRIEELSRTLKGLPLHELTQSLLATARSVEKLVATPGLEKSIESLNMTLQRIARLTDKLETNAGPLMESIKKTSDEARSTMAEMRQSFEKARIAETVAEMRKAAREADRLFADARGLVSPDSGLMGDLHEAMEDLAAAAQSIRSAADYIERNPEALIRGKRRR